MEVAVKVVLLATLMSPVKHLEQKLISAQKQADDQR